ncbi:MAG: CopY family transcriptional regulator [Planctomycetes bacterium SM23_65]|nr:MAG: CopY family transcriptional regulator [Planctomycetes bacterium SM23_65]
MARKSHAELSRRERQIMDIIYRRGEASVAQVLEDLPDTPTYSTVRTLLRILEEKGHLKHAKDGPRYVYRPTRPRSQAARSALKRLLETFFDGSAEKAVTALLDVSDANLTPDELQRLAKLIEKARKEGD